MKLRDFIQNELLEWDLPAWLWVVLFVIAMWT
jgi:hypothetical protein